jgi:gluconolactonase
MSAEIKEIASGLQFPEGPVAMQDGSLLVTEVAGGRLTRVATDGKLTALAETGGSPAGAAIGPDGRCYVCNGGGNRYRARDGLLLPAGTQGNPGRIEVVDLDSGRVEELYRSCDGKTLNAPNDIVFDEAGGFWFTDHGKTLEDRVDRGWICYAKADGSFIARVIGPLMNPNGIGLSPDNRRLYAAQTESARLWAFDLDGPGQVRRSPGLAFGRAGHFIAGPGGYRMFDSLAVDAEGWICVATLLDGGLTVSSPDGSEVGHIPLPDRYTTNVCFGLDQDRHAYVTLASSGKLVAVGWPRAGLPLNFSR